MMDPCETVDCEGWAVWRIVNDYRVREVCSDCRDELCATQGYEIL